MTALAALRCRPSLSRRLANTHKVETARRLAPEGYFHTYETMASAGRHGRGFRCGVPSGEIRLVCAA